jgi:hypothetical protein
LKAFLKFPVYFFNFISYFILKKDHPAHYDFMLAGMWGMRVGENRKLAQKLFEIIVDPSMITWYNLYKNDKFADQIFLDKYFRKEVELNVTAHDSFYCTKFGKYGVKPFPYQRPDNYYCHVGGRGCCGPAFLNASFPFECPLECRPKSFKEWVFC